MAEEEEISAAIVVDDSGRLRVLDPETNSQSCLVVQSCIEFQSQLQHFQNVTFSKRASSFSIFNIYVHVFGDTYRVLKRSLWVSLPRAKFVKIRSFFF